MEQYTFPMMVANVTAGPDEPIHYWQPPVWLADRSKSNPPALSEPLPAWLLDQIHLLRPAPVQRRSAGRARVAELLGEGE